MLRHTLFRWWTDLKMGLGQQETAGPSREDYSSGDQEEDSLRSWPPLHIIKEQEMVAFFTLLDDVLIQMFLRMDSCCRVSDKYLLAMTYIYFMRARLTLTRMNFFIALYLANIMEEEEWRNRFEIFPWALGQHWRSQFRGFLQQKDQLWARMEYRAAVSRHCCEEVMAVVPSHSLWKRERPEHHSGAQRRCSGEGYQAPQGPDFIAIPCTLCSRRALQTQESHTSDHTGSSELSAQSRGSEQKGSLVQISEKRRGAKRTRDGQLKDQGCCTDPCEDPSSRFDCSGSPQNLGSLSVGTSGMSKRRKITIQITAKPFEVIIPRCTIM